MTRAILAALAALAVLVPAARPGGAASPNFVPNGSFERSLAGWVGNHSRLELVGQGAVGRRAARVVRTSGSDYSIYSRARHVLATRAGTAYRAQAWTRSTRPGHMVCVRIREWSGSELRGSSMGCVRAARGWHRTAAVTYVTRRANRQLDVYAFQPDAGPGDTFDLDGVTLTRVTPPPPPSGRVAVLLAAGDIAGCGTDADEATARIVEANQGTVAALGDNVYESGSTREFAECYGPTWGRVKSRTRPAVGNHEYQTRGAGPYFAYFGASAGAPGKGWYSYELGTWHAIVLNSSCGEVGGCGPGSRQYAWLEQDLRSHRTQCTLAYWHYPRFSSGLHGNDGSMRPFWEVLHAAGAELVLNGHDHDYERFAPQAPDGRLDRARGIREFVVGTGGRSLRTFADVADNTEARDSKTFGVLRLTLGARGYAWRFLPIPGGDFADSGTGSCH